MTTNNPVEALVASIVASALAQTKVTEYESWPDWAEYMVMYSTKCWPCDWDEDRPKFFADKAELLAWVEKMNDWGTLEDNYYDVRCVYQWDLGPNLIDMPTSTTTA